jgi:hypothetical protein
MDGVMKKSECSWRTKCLRSVPKGKNLMMRRKNCRKDAGIRREDGGVSLVVTVSAFVAASASANAAAICSAVQNAVAILVNAELEIAVVKMTDVCPLLYCIINLYCAVLMCHLARRRRHFSVNQINFDGSEYTVTARF